MLIFIEKNDSDRNLRLELRRLQARYRTFERLQSKVLRSRCSSPGMLRDYMIWAALNQPAPVLIERSRIAHDEIFLYLTPRRMELLEYLRENPLNSIKELAEILKRDYKNVYDDVMALNRFELIEFIKEGKNRRPVTRVSRITIFMDRTL